MYDGVLEFMLTMPVLRDTVVCDRQPGAMLQPNPYMDYGRQGSVPEPGFMPPLPPDVSILYPQNLSAASQSCHDLVSSADLTLRIHGLQPAAVWEVSSRLNHEKPSQAYGFESRFSDNPLLLIRRFMYAGASAAAR